MSQNIKALGYLVGCTAVGVGLFYMFTPSSGSGTFQKMNENQGVLSRDISDAEKNTQNLLKKLKGTGQGPEKS